MEVHPSKNRYRRVYPCRWVYAECCYGSRYNPDYSANGKYVAQVYSIGAAPANTSTTVRLDNVEYTSLDMRTTIAATMSIYLTFNDGVHHPVYKYLTPYVEFYSDTNTANVRI